MGPENQLILKKLPERLRTTCLQSFFSLFFIVPGQNGVSTGKQVFFKDSTCKKTRIKGVFEHYRADNYAFCAILLNKQ
jgi:hypothetical protein